MKGFLERRGGEEGVKELVEDVRKRNELGEGLDEVVEVLLKWMDEVLPFAFLVFFLLLSHHHYPHYHHRTAKTVPLRLFKGLFGKIATKMALLRVMFMRKLLINSGLLLLYCYCYYRYYCYY